MKNIFKSVILDDSTKSGRLFDLFIQTLIIISLISFSLETVPNKSERYYHILDIVETITVMIFSFEYLMRLIFEKQKLKFVFSFYGLVDLLAILPFYLSTGLDLRSIRALRLLRLFKLFRYSKTIKRLQTAFKLAKQELVMFFSLTCIIIYISGIGIYYFENPYQPEKFSSVIDSLWWSVATLTTVGYGDVYPITVGGKIFTFIILMIGLGIVSIPSGVIAAAISEARKEENNN